MKTNPVKEKLRQGKPSFGTWLSLGNLHATRVLARSGFEWLTLDIEHSAFDWSEAATIFAAVADAGCVPLARVPEGDHYCIKRVLDAGAFGIVVPMVNTVEQARVAIAAAKYPPEGNRSVGGGMHSLNFAAAAGEYYQRANDEILVGLQPESPTAQDRQASGHADGNPRDGPPERAEACRAGHAVPGRGQRSADAQRRGPAHDQDPLAGRGGEGSGEVLIEEVGYALAYRATDPLRRDDGAIC